MALSKYKLGELIEQRREKYDNASDLPIRGVSRDGFIDAKVPGADLSMYNVFHYGDFVFNPARMELNSIAYNNLYKKGICSSLYEIFYVTKQDILLPEYLNLFVKRNEFARRCEFLGWGSAREYCRVSNLVDIEITLPSIEVQRKYVDVYMALQNNLKSYQSRVDELKLVCDGYIDQLKKKCKKETIGKYIIQCDERNADNKYTLENLRGISIQKVFIDTKADMMDVSLSPYILVKPKYFAFVPVTSRNGEKITIAYNDSEDTYIVSSAYNVFKIADIDRLDPEYLFMYLSRPEFDRYARFNSWGSAREVFSMDDMNDVIIPIPAIETQREIVKIHRCYIERQRIAAQLKEQLNRLCPIIIKGSLQTNN